MHLSRIAAAAFCLSCGPLEAAPKEPWTRLDQGAEWTQVRGDFYSRDQGSRLIPFAWIKALKRPDGRPFLEDGLARYGYLPNPDSEVGLPVGFHTAKEGRASFLGMTCAACHTRQIVVKGESYRIDGGPALADFQKLLTDLDAATGAVVAGDAAFAEFARAVLGANAKPAAVAELREKFDLWRLRHRTLVERALTGVNWGAGRLDAVSMIYNRLTGLDLGEPPTYLIEDNIKPADAPTRYPFLWNAAKQDKTQWPGFADNGSDLLGLPRNLGEALGVFAIFHPQPHAPRFLSVDYVKESSVNFDGLTALERQMKTLRPPRWPWPIDQALADRGEALFNVHCRSCHDDKTPGRTQFPNEATFKTSLEDVGTDTREYQVLTRRADPGVLTGARIPGLVRPLRKDAYAIDILAVATLGAISQNYVDASPSNLFAFARWLMSLDLKPSLAGIESLFVTLENIRNLSAGFADATPRYEGRVLHGVWAVAPYLHNGSVATLKDLLEPPEKRAVSFKVGPAYDIEAVGLAAEQPAGATLLTTTDCSDRNSGDSRCGHVYGAQLTGDEKKALLEYLKQL